MGIVSDVERQGALHGLDLLRNYAEALHHGTQSSQALSCDEQLEQFYASSDQWATESFSTRTVESIYRLDAVIWLSADVEEARARDESK